MANNNEFLEISSREEFKRLQDINKELGKIANSVENANKSFKNLKLPSQFRDSIAQLNNIIKQSNALLRTQLQLQERLAQAANANVTATNNNTRATIANERAERERLRTERERLRLSEDQRRASERQATSQAREERANRLLGSAYAQLSRQHAESARRLQDLIVRGRTATQTQREYDRELRNAQREFQTLNNRILAADRAVGRFNRNVGNYPKAMAGIRDLIGAFGIVGGVTAFAMITKDIFNTTRQLQSLDFALKQVVGTEQDFAQSQAFLTRISEAYGIEIQGLTRSYTSFVAASQNAIDSGAITAEQINQIFESVSKASGAMGLSVEQQQGAFLALQQMISKGNVQAEEIRGQLAERLPGAFGILAKSMGVTEVQLNKLLKDGKVLAAEVLPAFARELERAYGVENLDRVESLAAATTRLKNEWTDFVRELTEGDSVVTKFFNGFVEGAAGALKGLKLLMQNEQEREDGIRKSIGEQAYARQYEYLVKLKEANDDLLETVIKNDAGEAAHEKLKNLRDERDEIYKNIDALQKKLEAENNMWGMDRFSKTSWALDEQNEKLKRSEDQSEVVLAHMRAINDFLKKQDEPPKTGFGDGKSKRQKAEIDYLKEVYELRKQNTQNEISALDRIMNNEKKNYDVRLSAANDYYFQKEQLLKIEEEEENRLNTLSRDNQKKQYQEAIANGQATSDSLTKIEYQYLIRKQKINSEYEGKRAELAIESAMKLQGVLDSIEDRRRLNIVDQAQLDNVRQLNMEMGNLTPSSSYAKFKELEDRKTKILEDATEERIRIELQRTISQIEALTEDERASQVYQDLKAKEIELNSQLSDAEKTRIERTTELTLDLKRATDEYLSTFTDGIFADLGLSALEQFFKKGEDGLTEFERRFKGAGDNIGKQFQVSFLAITEIAQEAFNSLQQYSQQRSENEIAEIDMQQRLADRFAQTEEARQAIQDQADAKRREARRKEAQQQKEIALFNAVINTAQAVVAALPNIPLSVVIGALGAAKIALIASQEIPEFKEGVRGFGGGLAIVGDGGRHEVVRTPDGGLWRTPDTDTLVNLPKGSDVFKSDMDFLRNSGALLGGMPHIGVDLNGLTEQGLERVMRGVLSGSASNIITIDKRGVSAYTETSRSRSISHNNSITFKSRTFN